MGHRNIRLGPVSFEAYTFLSWEGIRFCSSTGDLR